VTTWADVVSSNGRLSGVDYRLVIEGTPYQFCTGGLASGTLGDTRQRVPGLQREGLGFAESVYLAGAEHDSSIGSAKIDEGAYAPQYRGLASWMFTRIARTVGYLTSTLSVVATTANVNDSSVFVNGYYHLATETVVVTARPTATTITITRGAWNTTAQEHPVTIGATANVVPILDFPSGMRKRRAWLYAHSVTELGTSDAGTVVWRGVVSKEPSSANADDGLAWSVPFSSRVSLLDASLAGGFDQPFALRGIYYPGEQPLRLQLMRHPTGDRIFTSGTPDYSATLEISGHWETQEDFAQYVSAAINADSAVATWSVLFEVRIDTRGVWELWYRTAAASPRYMQCFGGSNVDGFFASQSLQPDSSYTGAAALEDESVNGVDASSWYRLTRRVETTPCGVPFESQRQAPRSNNARGLGYSGTSSSAATSYPTTRLYLDRLDALTTSDALTIVPQVNRRSGPYADSDEAEADTQTLAITAVDAGSSYVEVAVDSFGIRVCATGDWQPSIEGSIVFASGAGNLEDLRADIVSRAPSLANRGKAPWLIDDDVASWADAVGEQATVPALSERRWAFVKPCKAIDVLREEWKLLRLIPYLDADFKLAVRPLVVDSGTPVAAIDSSSHLIDQGFGAIDGEADGLCTVVEVSTGWDPTEDKHSGTTHRYRNLAAIARVKDEVTTTIEPKSAPVGSEIGPAEVEAIGLPITTLFGSRRTMVATVRVTLSLFGVLLGDHVSVTVHQLPADGSRTAWTPGAGMIARSAIVIGRSWDFATGQGEFQLLMHELAVSGYSPSGFVTAAAGAGTAWTLTLTATRYSSGVDAAQFTPGDAIRLVEYDTAGAPTTREGTVSTVAGNDVAVTLASAWAGLGGAAYILIFDTSVDADTTADQLEYAYVAGPTQRIALVSGTSLAAEFSI